MPSVLDQAVAVVRDYELHGRRDIHAEADQQLREARHLMRIREWHDYHRLRTRRRILRVLCPIAKALAAITLATIAFALLLFIASTLAGAGTLLLWLALGSGQ